MKFWELINWGEISAIIKESEDIYDLVGDLVTYLLKKILKVS